MVEMILSLGLALVIGGAFGAVLDRIGATNPDWIGRMLNLSNLHLRKTILLAIGVASVLTFGGQMLGLVDVGHMSVKTAYIGVFVGGLMLGLVCKVTNSDVVNAGYGAGVLTVGAADNVVRLLPALNIPDADITEALERLDTAARSLEAGA
jgi:hypothetical protein